MSNALDTTEGATHSAGHVGKVFLPGSGTPVGKFDFLVEGVAPGTKVEIGTAVVAETVEGSVIGMVVDLRSVGRDSDPMKTDYGAQYDSAVIAREDSVVVATAQVFWSESIRPVRAGTVRAASVEEVGKATGLDRIEWPIPAGVVRLLDGEFARVSLDGHALLGPDSAHCMIGGISGQAAKTSYAGVLMKSCIEAGSPAKDSTAALVFNVKGDDLIYMDEKPAAGYELSDEDLAMYEALGVSPTPFADVVVYAPALPGGDMVRTARKGTVPLRWDLTMVFPYLRYLLPFLGDDEKAQSFLAELRDLLINNPNPHIKINTFAKLDAWFEDVLSEAEVEENTSRMAWRSHHVATVRRMRRMLMGLPARCGGLLAMGESTKSDDIPVRNWSHGQVVVVDIAGLSIEVQSLVIARTSERLLRAAEDGELGIDHLIVFADELNAFAPAVAPELPQVRNTLRKLTTQGRYAGISLIGAAQQLSKTDDLVSTNAATRVLGMSADSELASGTYGRLAAGLAERLATLPRGSMALWHYTFRSAMVVQFPRPAWRTGKAKGTANRRKGPQDILGLGSRSLERLTEGVSDELAEQVISRADSVEGARAALEDARVPDMRRIALHEPRTIDPDDPFAID